MATDPRQIDERDKRRCAREVCHQEREHLDLEEQRYMEDTERYEADAEICSREIDKAAPRKLEQHWRRAGKDVSTFTSLANISDFEEFLDFSPSI